MSQAIPTDAIDLRSDARTVDAGTVAGLAESIAEIGLINPIRVRKTGERWEVIAGAHRLAAVKSLGLAEIEATEVSDDDLRAELAMIDENLMRAELSPADRSRQTARRKAIYLELYPETAEGRAQALGMNRAQGNVTENISATLSFAADAAAKTGQSDRIVRLYAERGEKVIAEVLDMVKGTKLDTGTYLDKIKDLSANDQVRAVKRDLAVLLAKERDKVRRAKQGKSKAAPISDEEAKEKQVAALMAAWNKASAEARQEFLERIDAPVFDRSAA